MRTMIIVICPGCNRTLKNEEWMKNPLTLEDLIKIAADNDCESLTVMFKECVDCVIKYDIERRKR